MLVAGCSSAPSDDSEPHSVGGPLRAPVDGEAGVSVLAPDGVNARWAASFSGLPLCVDGGSAGRLRVVEVADQVGDVHDLEVFVATPTSAGATVLTSALGKAPQFAEVYADPDDAHWERSWEATPLEGAEIPSCDIRLEKQPHLVLTFATEAGGGAIREWSIVYEASGRAYRTESIRYTMALCGSADVGGPRGIGDLC